MTHLGSTILFVAEFINMNRFHLHFYAFFGAIRLNIMDAGIQELMLQELIQDTRLIHTPN